MEQFTVNLVAKAKRVTRNGKTWWVAPATLIVPGVLNGSQGALYYPPEHVERHVKDWDRIPLVAYHPTRDGQPVSASGPDADPDILRTHGLGEVIGNTWDGTKHVGEAWFDEQQTRNVDAFLRQQRGVTYRPILPRLERGEPIELSTGLYTDNAPAANGSNYNGRSYTHIATNYRPDHLAVLPDQVGACSVQDGCGINVNQADPTDSLMEAIGPFLGVNVAGQVRSEVTGWFKRYGAGHGKGDIHEMAQAGFQTSKVSTEHVRLGLIAKTEASVGQNPPSWAVDEDTWDRAKGAAAKSGHEEDWPYVVSIYQSMGGETMTQVEQAEAEVRNEDLTINPFVSEEQRRACYAKDDPNWDCEEWSEKTNNQESQEGVDMATREQKVKQLTHNCDCWKGKEKVLANAELFSDADIDNLIQNAGKVAVANTLAKGIKLPGQAVLVFNSQGKPVIRNAMDEAVPECAPDDAECLAMMEEKKPAAPFPPAANQQKETRAMTVKEWEDSMPPEARRVWNASKKVEEKARLEMVGKLVANIDDDGRRNTVGNRLMLKSYEELEEMVELLPTANQRRDRTDQATESTTRTYNFLGAAGAFDQYSRPTEGADEMLDLPTMNWGRSDNSKKVKQQEEEMELV